MQESFRSTFGALSALALGIALAGCVASSPYDRAAVSKDLNARTGAPIAPDRAPGKFVWPEGVSADDGLAVEDAVATALWNNAGLEQALADLGIARADVIAASKLPNPSATILFPGGPRIFETTLSIPIELLMRDGRIRQSRSEVERVAAEIEETGLALVRDVHAAYAELEAARAKASFLQQLADLTQVMARISADRREVGRVSEHDAAQLEADAADAAVQAQAARRDARLAGNRLVQLLGFPGTVDELRLGSRDLQLSIPASEEALLAEAMESRPALRASEAALLSAGAQAGIERTRLLNFVADVKITKDKGGDAVAGPGGKITLPIFDQNQAGMARARATMEKALAGHVAAQRLVRRQVEDASATYVAASRNYATWRDSVLPNRQREADLTRHAFEQGQASYFDWVLAQTRFAQAQIALTDTALALHLARAELERSIGRRLKDEDFQND